MSSAEEQRRAAEQERERQRDHEAAVRAMEQPRQGEDVYQDIMAELTETDALAPGSKQILRNLITKDWVLANLKEEEVHELRWELEILKEMFYDLHPDEESIVTGEVRAYVYDDSSERLTPLTEKEIMATEAFFRDVRLRLTRSRDFAQQEIIRTDIKQTQVNKPEHGSDSGGLLGRFR